MFPHHSGLLAEFFYFFLRLGSPGLVLLGVLDSSFLTLPFANDLAVIALVSLHHERMPLYAAAATVGSVAGCWIMYRVGYVGGETFLHAHLSEQRFQVMKEKAARRGPVLLAVPALIPPPFPFSAWVLAAGALEVPQQRFFATLAAMRFIRFVAEGVAAIVFGRGIVRWMNTPGFRAFIEGLVVLALLASAYSIFTLVRSTRRGRPLAGRPL